MTQLQFRCPMCTRFMTANSIRVHRKHHAETGACPPTQAEVRRMRAEARRLAKPPRKPISNHSECDLAFIRGHWT